MPFLLARPVARPRFVRLATAAAILTAVAAPSFAAKADRAALLPAGAAYVFALPDSAAAVSATKANSLYRALETLAKSDDFAAQTGDVKKWIADMEGKLGFPLDAATLSGIVTDVTLFVAAGDSADDAGMGIVAGIGDKAKAEKITTLVEEALALSLKGDSETPANADAASSSPVTREDYKGVSIRRYAPDDDTEFFYAFDANLMFAASDRAQINAVIDRHKAGAAAVGTLATDPNYKKVVGGLAARPGEAMYYSNAQRTADMAQAGPGLAQFREIFDKISSVQAVGSTIKINPKDISGFSYGVVAEGPGSAALKRNPGDKPLAIAGYAPKDTLLVFALSVLDPDLYFQLLTQYVGAQGGTEEFDKSLEQAEKNFGFSVKDDLIAALGNEVGLFINNVQIANPPQVDAALALRIRDKAKMAKVLGAIDKLVAALPIGSAGDSDDEPESGSAKKKPAAAGFKTKTVGKLTAKYITIPQAAGYSPGYAVDGDYLLIASNTDTLQKAAETRAGTKPGLTTSDAFQRVGPRVTTTANGFQYLNLAGVWSSVRLAAGIFGGEATPQINKVIDALQVIQTAAGSTSYKDGAVLGESILVLN